MRAFRVKMVALRGLDKRAKLWYGSCYIIHSVEDISRNDLELLGQSQRIIRQAPIYHIHSQTTKRFLRSSVFANIVEVIERDPILVITIMHVAVYNCINRCVLETRALQVRTEEVTIDESFKFGIKICPNNLLDVSYQPLWESFREKEIVEHLLVGSFGQGFSGFG